MAETQHDHRLAIELLVVTSNTKRSQQGVFVGGTVTMLLICLAAYAVHLGYPIVASIVALSVPSGVLIALVLGKQSSKQDNEQRANLVKKLADGIVKPKPTDQGEESP